MATAALPPSPAADTPTVLAHAPGDGPLLTAATQREQYAHVARQRCGRCDGTFAVVNEAVASDPATGQPVHVLEAACLNSDCGQPATFRFAARGLLLKGVASAVIDGADPHNPARMFPSLAPPDEVAIRLLSVACSVRAAGLDEEKGGGLMDSVVAGLELDEAGLAAVRAATTRGWMACQEIAGVIRAAGAGAGGHAGNGRRAAATGLGDGA